MAILNTYTDKQRLIIMARTYKIIDKQTGLQVGKDYTNRVKASAKVDKLDNEHGGYRYYVKPVYDGVEVPVVDLSKITSNEVA